jgi:hypothetical protein
MSACIKNGRLQAAYLSSLRSPSVPRTAVWFYQTTMINLTQLCHTSPPPVLPPHAIEFVIGAHGSEIGHAVAETEEGGDSGDIPGILVAETTALKSLDIGTTDGLRQVAEPC